MTRERPPFYIHERRFAVAAARLKVPVETYVAALNAGNRICGGCRKELPRTTEYFVLSKTGFDGMRSKCVWCHAGVKKTHYQRTREAARIRRKRYQEANRAKVYAYNAQWQRERHRLLRAEMFNAYGKVCACCGEDELIFLDLDHVDNDGAAHRRELGNQDQVLVSLQKQRWPKGRFQVLCSNCNQGKYRNAGTCPHKTRALAMEAA